MLLYVIKIVILRSKKLEEHLRNSCKIKINKCIFLMQDNDVYKIVTCSQNKTKKYCAISKVLNSRTIGLKISTLNHCAKGRVYIKCV